MEATQSTREFFEKLDWTKPVSALALEAKCTEANIRYWKAKLGKTRNTVRSSAYLQWFRTRVNSAVSMTTKEVAEQSGCPEKRVKTLCNLFAVQTLDSTHCEFGHVKVDWSLPTKVIADLFGVPPYVVSKHRKVPVATGSYGNYGDAIALSDAIQAQVKLIREKKQ